MSLGRQLFKNSTINLVGQILPLIAAVICVPEILRQLGEGRLGILALAWMFIGYFTLFDLGLGRAVTKEVSRIGESDLTAAAATFWTGTISSMALGILGGTLFYLLTPYLVGRLLNIPDEYLPEALSSFYSISYALPFVISGVSFRGYLEARGRFLTINLIQIPLGITNYVIPVWMSQNSHDLGQIVSYLMLARVTAWFFMATLSLRNLPHRSQIGFNRKRLGELLGFGGWITLSNVVSPLIGYVDRFLVGSTISAAAVAYYATPYEMIMRLWIIPNSITTVLFPLFSAISESDRTRRIDLFYGSTKIILLLMLPIGLALSVFSFEILSLWLGPNFANESHLILWWFGIAIIINSLGFIPSCYLQARGRPDLPAKIIAAELPFYITLVSILINYFGVHGAAIAWFIRVSIDYLLLFYFSKRELQFAISIRLVAFLSYGAMCFYLTSTTSDLSFKLLFYFVCISILPILFWKVFLTFHERTAIKGVITSLKR